MSILKKPDLADPKLRAKLAKGMGHNYYGEPAWPNDLLYIFWLYLRYNCLYWLRVMSLHVRKSDPLLPHKLQVTSSLHLTCYVIPNKLIGVGSMAMTLLA